MSRQELGTFEVRAGQSISASNENRFRRVVLSRGIRVAAPDGNIIDGPTGSMLLFKDNAVGSAIEWALTMHGHADEWDYGYPVGGGFTGAD